MYCKNCNKEITGEAAFCMYCGAVLEVEGEKPQNEIIMEKDEPAESTIKRGRGSIFAMILILTLILLICYGMYQKTPNAQIEEALENGQVDIANSFFYNLEERDDIFEAKDMAKEYAAQLVENYINEKESYDYSLVSADLEELARGILAEESAVMEKINLVDQINTSRAKYETGVKYAEAGNFTEAIKLFKEVISEDAKYYAEAQAKLPELIKTVREESIESAKQSVEAGDYNAAKAILEEALKVIPEDSQIVSELDVVKNTIRELEIEAVIESVNDHIENGNYSQAFWEMEKAMEKYSDSSIITLQNEKLKSTYKETQVSKLKELHDQEEFTQAILLIDETLAYLPSDSEIVELRIQYESYLPVPLVSLEVYDKRCVQDINATLNDNFGNSYSNSACLTAEEAAFSGSLDSVGKLEYLINGSYNRISGTLAYWGDVYRDYRRGESHLEIYSDDVLVYTSPTITEDSKPVYFEAKLGEGCHKLKLRLVPENIFDSYVVLGDMKVYNR